MKTIECTSGTTCNLGHDYAWLLLRWFSIVGSTYLYIGFGGWSWCAIFHYSAAATHQWWTLAWEPCHWLLRMSTCCSRLPASRSLQHGIDTRWRTSCLEPMPCRWVCWQCTDHRPAHTGWCSLNEHHQYRRTVHHWRSADRSHIFGTRGQNPHIVVGCGEQKETHN